MNSTDNTTEVDVDDNNEIWFGMTIFSSTYFTVWLIFLTCKYMQDATAGHIFEINVLLSLVTTILVNFARDLAFFEDCTFIRFLESSTGYNYYMSTIGSHIETAIFLKTYSVNTMYTNTAGWICLGMWLGSLPLAAIISFALPESRNCPPSRTAATSFCDYFGTTNFYRKAIPSFMAISILLSVMAFMIYRSHQFRKSGTTQEEMEMAVIELDNERRKDEEMGQKEQDNDDETEQSQVDGPNQEPEQHMHNEGDIVVEDIEVEDEETLPRKDAVQKEDKENVADAGDEDENENADIIRKVQTLDKDIVDDAGDEENSLNTNADIILNVRTLEKQTKNALETGDDTVIRTGKDPNMFFKVPIERAETPETVPCFGTMNTNLAILQKFIGNTALTLVLLGIDVPYTAIIFYRFISSSKCGDNPDLQKFAEASVAVAGLCIFMMPVLIKKKIQRLSA